MATYTSKISLNGLDGSTAYANEKGIFECVALVQKVSGIPHTTTWEQGMRVMDCAPGTIVTGTVIATFDENGKYPLTTARHAALYEKHDASGITVVDQWNAQMRAKRRLIRLKNEPVRNVNDARWYYIVETDR